MQRGGFLDIRIEKTERAIKQAFMELRREKAGGKDPCQGAVRPCLHQ